MGGGERGGRVVLVEGKGRGGGDVFISSVNFFTLIPVPLSSWFLSFISSTIASISFLPFSRRRHKMTHKLNTSTIKISGANISGTNL